MYSVLNIVFVIFLTFFTLLQNAKVTGIDYYKNNKNLSVKEFHKHLVDEFFRKRESWTTSALGSVLFKNKKYPEIEPSRKNKIFKILIWKLINNSTEYYLSNCSVQNCIVHGKKEDLDTSDAVVVIPQHFKFGYYFMYPFRYRRGQMFIFYDVETPVTVPILPRFLMGMSNRFNWSMTYRTDSDVPIPHGRVEPLAEPIKLTSIHSVRKLVPYWNKKTKRVLVAAMISNCRAEYRLQLIKTLRKHITVHFFGGCGDGDDKFLKYSCGSRLSTTSCLRRYHFYLALENSFCRQYITEKVFTNAYMNGAIPIIKGASPNDCAKLLPPHSYILVDNFKSTSQLAKEIFSLSESNEKLLSYHVWRAHFKIMPENGFIGPNPIAPCRLCEAMNYNSLKKSIYTYDDIRLHLDRKIVCDISNTIYKKEPLPRDCFKLISGTRIELY